LRLIECEQIAVILDNKYIRDKLESVAIDVEELKLVLSGDDDELLEKFKKLESNIDDLRSLNECVDIAENLELENRKWHRYYFYYQDRPHLAKLL
jgi:hypothetical protein